MRILHTIRSVNPEGGGVIETVKQFSRVLERQGHDVTIASLDTPDEPWVKDCPHHVKALGPARANYGMSPRFVPWLREHAPKFDAIVVNGIWQFNSFGVWKALRGTGKKLLCFSARHARSVVQAHVSTEAREEVALLAVGRVSRLA